jgi:hypothetical protein
METKRTSVGIQFIQLMAEALVQFKLESMLIPGVVSGKIDAQDAYGLRFPHMHGKVIS